MKVIFLDIDGVLNCSKSRSRCGKCLGIDNAKALMLAQIVDKTQAKIVLVSTWKHHWYRNKRNKYKQDNFANYLDKKFHSCGLEVFDKTCDKVDGVYFSRGESILYYIQSRNVESYVIIDDYQFDYDGCSLTDNYIKTNNDTGLTSENVFAAIDILNKGK